MLDGKDDSINGNIDIIETGVTIDNVYTSFLVRTKEPMFTVSDGTTIRILIDSDNNQNSGYYYPGMGADHLIDCLLYTSPSPRDKRQSRMPSSA